LGWALPLTALLSAAADLGVAAARGYLFRTDAVVLIATSVATVALLSGAALAVLWALGRRLFIGRAPHTCVLTAALWPILFQHVYLTGRPALWWPDVATIALLVGVGLIEIRRGGRGPGPRFAWTLVGLSAVALTWSLVPRLPGASLLRAPSGPAVAASPERPNLILIVLDTLNASHLGLYGYPRPVSPWLDEYAAGSAVFEHAVSSSSWTLPAHATLFTGLFSRAHGADLAEDVEPDPEAAHGLAGFSQARPLSAEATTLAEVAERAGLDTAAICANNSFLHRFFGLDQGFRSYVDVLPVEAAAESAGIWFAARAFQPLRFLANGNGRVYLMASEVNALALRWLESRKDRRFFLFLNYMDAHDPYLPVGEYRQLFPAAWPPGSVDADAIRSRRRGILPEERAALVDPYDAEIRYLDDQLRALFGRLESWGILENSLVVIVGDHGESFGEHYDLGHGNGVYEAEVRVPLIVRLPGQAEGSRVERVVHLVDVLPTVLSEMGLEDLPDLQGNPLHESERLHAPVAYSARFPNLAAEHPGHFDRSHYAVYEDPWKLIVRSDGEVELYDIRSDRQELDNLAGRRPEIVTRLSETLTEFEETVQPRFVRSNPPRDPELLERLRALGYVQ
jgi:arylsulfatase A-like enzyme